MEAISVITEDYRNYFAKLDELKIEALDRFKQKAGEKNGWENDEWIPYMKGEIIKKLNMLTLTKRLTRKQAADIINYTTFLADLDV